VLRRWQGLHNGLVERGGAVRPGGLRAALLLAALVGVAVLLAACGGAPSASVAAVGSSATSTTAAPGAGSSRSLEKFVSCMRGHGVPNFPDLVMTADGGVVPVGPVSIDKHSPQVQAARATCQKLLPPGLGSSGPGSSPSPPITRKDKADYLKAARCMRAHGIIDFPDPTFSANGVDFPPPPGMTARIGNSPTFVRAQEICEKLIPSGLPYSDQAAGGQ
jgi:hypothetical protein